MGRGLRGRHEDMVSSPSRGAGGPLQSCSGVRSDEVWELHSTYTPGADSPLNRNLTGTPNAQLPRVFQRHPHSPWSWSVPWGCLACYAERFFLPQGASTTNSANSYAHFTAQDKNKLKLLKPPDTKAASSKLGFKALCRCAHPPVLPQDVCPTSHSSCWVWVSLAVEARALFSPCPLLSCPGALASVSSPVSQTMTLLVLLVQPPINAAEKLKLLTDAHSKETQPLGLNETSFGPWLSPWAPPLRPPIGSGEGGGGKGRGWKSGKQDHLVGT